MADRETLAQLLCDYEHLYAVEQADVILAAGWHPPAPVIVTAEELDALPDRTVIRTGYDTAAQKSDDVWEFPNEVGQFTSEAIDLPATVLWRPEGSDHA